MGGTYETVVKEKDWFNIYLYTVSPDSVIVRDAFVCWFTSGQVFASGGAAAGVSDAVYFL